MLSFQDENLAQRVGGSRVPLVRLKGLLDIAGTSQELRFAFILALCLVLAGIQSLETEKKQGCATIGVLESRT